MPTSETGIVDLLKRLRSNICCDSRCNLRRLLPIYQRLLSPHKDPLDNSIEHNRLNIRAKLRTCSEYTDIIDIVDHVVERCLSLDEQLQQHNVQVTVFMEEVIRLLVALAGGEDGKTFVLVDTVQLYDARKKRMGERTGMTDVEMVRRPKSLFCKAPVPLEEKA
ncbi:unnamed protein product [Peronospora destructor]|nr:unnamed protein product [Peronospora destructor]